MLQPDSDEETTQQEKKQRETTATTSKKTKVKIEIDDDEEEEVEVPIKKNGNKTKEEVPKPSQQQVQAQQQPQLSLPGSNKDHYHFKYISDRKPFPFLGGDRELTDSIKKWGLFESMSCLQFSYEMIVDDHTLATSKSATVPGQVHAALLPEFTVSLLNSDDFKANFKCGDGKGNSGGQNSVPVSYPAPVTSVKMQVLRCQETTLEMFDRLVASSSAGKNEQDDDDDDEENKKSVKNKNSDKKNQKQQHPRMVDLPHQIVRENGRSCMMQDVYLPCGITVSDQLRGVFMLNEEEGECYDAFSEEERNEFLWHVMRRLVSGGAVNQYEDEFEPYKDATREVYKSLISVGRSAANKSVVEVQSLVGLVSDVKCGGSTSIKKTFFPKDDRTGNHNFLYVIVDPFRKTCIVWYNAFFSPF